MKKDTEMIIVKKTRDSNIELLRIVAMMMIIMHHLVYHTGVYKIIGNISSINGIYNDIVSISANNTFKHLKQLEDSIAQIASRTNFLYDYIKNDKEGKLETSKVVINRVSELLDLTADAVTSSVTILHLYNQVTAMTTNMLNELKKHA